MVSLFSFNSIPFFRETSRIRMKQTIPVVPTEPAPIVTSAKICNLLSDLLVLSRLFYG